MCRVFRDVFLYVTVLLGGYFSYCCLPVSLNQFGRSPVTSLITSPFHPQNWHSLLFLFFSVISLLTLEAVVHKKSSNIKLLSINLQYISGYLLLLHISSWIIYSITIKRQLYIVTSQLTGAGNVWCTNVRCRIVVIIIFCITINRWIFT